jgi:hypothetical protein
VPPGTPDTGMAQTGMEKKKKNEIKCCLKIKETVFDLFRL